MEKLNSLLYYQKKKSHQCTIQEICVFYSSSTAGAPGWLLALWKPKMLSHSLYCILLSIITGTSQDIHATGPVQWPVSNTVGQKCSPKHSRRQTLLTTSVSPPGGQYHSMFFASPFCLWWENCQSQLQFITIKQMKLKIRTCTKNLPRELRQGQRD